MFEWFDHIIAAGIARRVFVIELIVAELLFMLPFKRRKQFALRASLSVLIYFGFGLFFPEHILNIGSYITIPIFLLSMALHFFCFDHSFTKVAFNCIGAYAVQSLTTNASICVRVLLQSPAEYRLLVDFCCAVVIYAVCYFLFARKSRNDDEINIDRIKMMLLSVAVILLVDIMSKMATAQGVGANIVCRVSLSCSNLLALSLQYSTFRVGKLETENSKMESLLRAEQEQYRLSRETIDLVNMKCHDLKHQLAQIRSGLEGAGSEALREMEDAVLFYESVAKTGNDALDSILTEKSLFCERYRINLTYIADGKSMNCMKPSDLYSLMGNAIDNAIECVMRESDAEKRVIFLNVSGKGDMLSIHLENYCGQTPVFENGLPVTSKSDKQNHGIGVKSIRYIAAKYGGNAVFGVEDNLFTLDIMIPIPPDRAEPTAAE